jgi:hypothetical protein
MKSKTVAASAFGALFGLVGFTAGCAGKGNGKPDAAGDTNGALTPDGPNATGGTMVSYSGGATGTASGTGGSGAQGGTGGASVTGGGGVGTTGGTMGGGGTSAGGTGIVPVCCGFGADCPKGYSCAGSSDELTSRLGRCEATPANGNCYNDLDCPQDGLCRSAVTCACDAECFAANQPGTCLPTGEACCQVNADCADGERCIGALGFTKGRCMTAPNSSQCYSNADCSVSHFCYRMKICACGTNCSTVLSWCAIE